jgi:hypothetical protein
MTDTSIIDNNVNEVNVLSEYFEIVDEDVYHTFKGFKAGLKSGRNNVLYGKTINLSKMYDVILCDVVAYIQSDEYLLLIDKKKVREDINHYVTVRYGVSYEWIYNMVYGNDKKSWVNLKTDVLFEEWIRYKKGDVSGIDWLKIYSNFEISTNKDEVLIYIANEIIKGSIYEYFVDRYKLRVDGIDYKDRFINDKLTGTRTSIIKSIVLKYNTDDGKSMKKLVPLGDIKRDKRDWWIESTYNSLKHRHGGRSNIQDYDVLLAGRCEDLVLPEYCPVFSNLRMNYTGIDFDGKDNIKKCSEVAGYSDKGETWSFASIDRVDSNKGYTYDNVRVISDYANLLKNKGTLEQVKMVLEYMKSNLGLNS